MTVNTFHTQQADTHLRYAGQAPTSDADWAQANATLALTHATLALVEEQRTANLLAALTAGHFLGFDEEDDAWGFIADRLGTSTKEG